MLWKTRHRCFDFSAPPGRAARGIIIGILNLTRDSFSDGGRFVDPQAAVAHALAMEAAGAEVIDIGGESTRPGAAPVSEKEELARVLPVIAALKEKDATGAPRLKAEISIDTRKAAVAAAALEAGAGIVNDISALRGDPAMAATVARANAGLLLMHMRGEPPTMQHAPRYDDAVAQVRAFLGERAAVALAAGIAPEQIVLDPGPGFGKTFVHNVTLLRRIMELAPPQLPQRPMVWAVSRKRFLGELTGRPALEERFWPTVALTSVGRELGALIFRVHDVPANLQALRMTEAILG